MRGCGRRQRVAAAVAPAPAVHPGRAVAGLPPSLEPEQALAIANSAKRIVDEPPRVNSPCARLSCALCLRVVDGKTALQTHLKPAEMAAQAAQDGRTSPSLQEPKPAHAGVS